MQSVAQNNFTTVKTEGAILPADLLQRIAGGKMDGLQPADYHLAPDERLNEAVNRAWNRCLGVWQSFDDQRQQLSETDSGTSLTRERWLLIIFQELGYGRLPFQQRSLEIPDQQSSTRYPISHLWQNTPIHLVSFRQELDRRDPTIKRSPHSLMQEFLNRSDDFLWGFVSNGLTLQILRDNISLTRAAYLEFDMEKMMTEQIYADFTLLWLICHQSRVEVGVDPDAPALPSNCWLERWSQQAAEQGTRALEALRNGVQETIAALGRGFLAHPGNEALKRLLRTGTLSREDYFRQLLRLVYRLIFLFVAEDRDLLLLLDADVEARYRYNNYYAAGRLRHLAEGRRGGPHPDLYRALRRVFFLLRNGYPDLGLPALGSFLFSDRSTPALDDADIANSDLLNAVRALAFTFEGQVRRPIDYKNLDTEELGSVYESLLELHPTLNIDAATFTLDVIVGSERKTTGTHYTPASLIRVLLDNTLEPIIRDRLDGITNRQGDVTSLHSHTLPAEEAILSIKVVDLACGSGHPLIAAARRLAAHLARVLTGDDEPSPAARREALRKVVHHCIYGVDINEMAVELCKVGLWLETLDPGKPLGFLDRNIQCGNSLIGATPALLQQGIPDEAFTPITGDDKDYCREWKARNKKEREGQLSMRFGEEPWQRLGDLATAMAHLDSLADGTIAGVRAQEVAYAQLIHSNDYEYSRLWADTWCAAFVWKKTTKFDYPITEQAFRKIEHNPFDIAPWMRTEIERLRDEYQFFHWHQAFPHVFQPKTIKVSEISTISNQVVGWEGGFDVVLGNMPWEMMQMDPREFFAARAHEIAEASSTTKRDRLIRRLKNDSPELYSEYQTAKRVNDGAKHFVHHSGSYPLTSYGRLNLAPLFAELVRHIVAPKGRIGIIVPTAIATTSFTQYYFADLIDTGSLISLYDFENQENIFPGVHREQKFCLLTISGEQHLEDTGPSEFVFFARRIEDIKNKERVFTLKPHELKLLNPNTRTCPIFRQRRDAKITKDIYSRIPVLVNEEMGEHGDPWLFRPNLMFMMNTASVLFQEKDDLLKNGWELDQNVFRQLGDSYIPLYEGKLTQIFDHRFATFADLAVEEVAKGNPREMTTDEHIDNESKVIPRYWIPQSEFHKAISVKPPPSAWLTFHDIANPNNERTFIAAICPPVAAGNTLPVVMAGHKETTSEAQLLLCANWNAFLLDYVARLKIGSRHLNFYVVKQLPIIPPEIYYHKCHWERRKSILKWLKPRILELSYTSWDLRLFAQDCGYHGPPFRWDEERRFLLRCELDAAYFHLYGIERDDVAYIMDTFPIVRRKDEDAYDEYRTKRVILEIYDEMAEAKRSREVGEQEGCAYQTRLNPPPVDPRVAHAWDEEYLGPYRDSSSRWENDQVTVEAMEQGSREAGESARATKKRGPVYKVRSSSAAIQKEEQIRAEQRPLLNVMPAPTGPRSRRLKRAMALGKDLSAAATHELVAFLADDDSNIRWLAGSSLVQRASGEVVTAIAAFLDSVESERVERAKPEIQRVLGLIAETAEDERLTIGAKQILKTLVR